MGKRNPHGDLPPGHEKKVHGDKSARRHAPGQKKKKREKKQDAIHVYNELKNPPSIKF